MGKFHNQRGSVIVFTTLLIVLLLIMVGMGLDTGHLVYVRAQGQAAVDAAALAAASAIPTGSRDEVNNRAANFDSKNNYVGSPANTIGASNVTLVKYSSADGSISTAGVTIATANGARVALESTNPYTGTSSGNAINAPVFLMPLLNLFGQSASSSENINVSAVAVLDATPGLPIAIEQARCSQPNPQKLLQTASCTGNNCKYNDNSGYTTYSINATSASEIRALLSKGSRCGLPAVNTGTPTNLNNGQIGSVYSDFGTVFSDNPGDCYLIPVVRTGSNWNQTENIIDFAKFCPVSPAVVSQGSNKYIQGNVTCGQNPYDVTGVNCYVTKLVRDRTSGM